MVRILAPESAKKVQNLGEDPRFILHHDLKGNDPAMEHILEGPDRIPIFVKRAAADPRELDRLVDRFGLPRVQHAPGFHHFAEDLRRASASTI